MGVLSNLEPKKVFAYFEEICGIPHISYHEKQLSDYCVNFARERGLFCTQDEMGNVLIVGEATPGYEEEETIMIQGHLDMVGDKTSTCGRLNLETDPITVETDGEYVFADGTTLGGDNGIAVAYALAILDSDDIPHPRLEVILTVSEEVGLLGATAMDLSMCKGRRLLNLDSEEEGILTAGCAGGRRAECRIPLTRVKGSGLPHLLTIEGLQGGHSGIEIHKGRANVSALWGRFLALLQERASFQIVSAFGGVKENVIPKEGRMTLLMEPGQEYGLIEAVEMFHEQVKAEYGTADPDISLKVSVGKEVSCMVLDEVSVKKVIAALNLMPWGVQAMSMDLPGLVETSANIGVMHLEDEELELRISIRSSVASAKEYISRKVQLLVEMLGGTVEFMGDYPAWPYARESKLRDTCIEVFEKQYDRKPEVQLLHAGLECGILSDKIEGLDCISFGPNMHNVHTTDERLDIASVARTWEYLKAILAVK